MQRPRLSFDTIPENIGKLKRNINGTVAKGFVAAAYIAICSVPTMTTHYKAVTRPLTDSYNWTINLGDKKAIAYHPEIDYRIVDYNEFSSDHPEVEDIALPQYDHSNTVTLSENSNLMAVGYNKRERGACPTDSSNVVIIADRKEIKAGQPLRLSPIEGYPGSIYKVEFHDFDNLLVVKSGYECGIPTERLTAYRTLDGKVYSDTPIIDIVSDSEKQIRGAQIFTSDNGAEAIAVRYSTILPENRRLMPGVVVEIGNTGSCVNAHELPDLSSPTLFCYSDGKSFLVEDGPVDNQGYRWWQISSIQGHKTWVPEGEGTETWITYHSGGPRTMVFYAQDLYGNEISVPNEFILDEITRDTMSLKSGGVRTLDDLVAEYTRSGIPQEVVSQAEKRVYNIEDWSQRLESMTSPNYAVDREWIMNSLWKNYGPEIATAAALYVDDGEFRNFMLDNSNGDLRRILQQLTPGDFPFEVPKIASYYDNEIRKLIGNYIMSEVQRQEQEAFIQ